MVGDCKATHGIWSMWGAGDWFVFLLLQVSLPASEDTLYWCKIFRLPNVRRKHHMVRVSFELISITNTLRVTNLLSTYHAVCSSKQTSETTPFLWLVLRQSLKLCSSDSAFCWTIGGSWEDNFEICVKRIGYEGAHLFHLDPGLSGGVLWIQS